MTDEEPRVDPVSGPPPGRPDRTTGTPDETTGTSTGSTTGAAVASSATVTRPEGNGTTTAESSGGSKLTDRIPKAPNNVREFFSRRTTVGPGAAAQAVVTDISDLVRAEVALAKSELSQKAAEKGMGAGLFAGAAVAGWLGLQGLLITIALVLALFLPGWAAALIVTAVLLIVAGVLALIAKKKFSTPLALETTRRNVQEDVAWAKAHLKGPAQR